MIVETRERDIQHGGLTGEENMGIAEGSEAFIFNVLRNDLYKNPIGSFLRELCTNARDEHRTFRINETPIELTLPTELLPEFRVRDFAGGLLPAVYESACPKGCGATVTLTPDWRGICSECGEKGKLVGGVKFYFGKYGASSKRDTNDLVGMYGLGCKSPFAYTDSYLVKSFHNGVVYLFNLYIDESEVGRVAFVSQEPTDEPNGLLVTVPIKVSDVNKVRNRAIETVRHFATKPNFLGVAEQPTFDDKPAAISGEGWRYYGSGSPVCIMGEIAYPIDSEQIEDLQAWEETLLNSQIHILAEIGEVQVTASREALKMTPKTIAAIRKRLVAIKDEMVLQTLIAFEACESLYAAKVLYNRVMKEGGGYGEILEESGEEIEWRGQKITDNAIKLPFGSRLLTYTKKRRGISHGSTDKILCTSGLEIYYDDTDRKMVNYKRRAKTIFDGGGVKDVLILQSDNPAELESLLGLPVSTFRSYNEIVPTVPPSMRMGGQGTDLRKRAKHQTKIFQLDLDRLAGWSKGAASDCWNITTVDLNSTPGLFVSIDRFHPEFPGVSGLLQLESLLNELKSAGIKVTLPIFGVKRGGQTGNLQPILPWIKKQLNGMKKAKSEYAFGLAFNRHSLFDFGSLKASDFPVGPLRTYIETYNRAKLAAASSAFSTRGRLFNRYGINITPFKGLEELSDEFEKTFPLLKFIAIYNYTQPSVKEYIQDTLAKLSV
jgi:hypothetical protein